MNDGMGASRAEGAKTIKGEVLRVEGENYVVTGNVHGFPAVYAKQLSHLVYGLEVHLTVRSSPRFHRTE